MAALHLPAGLQTMKSICGQRVSRFLYMRGIGALASLPHLLPWLVAFVKQGVPAGRTPSTLYDLDYSINRTMRQVGKLYDEEEDALHQ